MSGIFYSLLFAMQISLIYSQYPRFYTRCRLWDSGCLTRQVQLQVPAFAAGIREIGTEVLDPMRIEYARIDVAGMKMEIRNGVLRGFGSSIIDRVSVDPYSKQLHLVYHTDLTLDSLYTVGGNYFGLPFTGDGNLKIKTKNVQIDTTMSFEIVKDAYGRDVMDIKGFQFKADFKEPVQFDFTNLYYGNKQLSDWVLQYLNANWKITSDTYTRSILNVAKEKLFKSLRTYLLTQPIDQIFLL